LKDARKTVLSHSVFHGAVWKFIQVDLDNQTTIFSAGSDGSIRAGIVASLLLNKQPYDGLLECARFLQVEECPAVENDQPKYGRIELELQPNEASLPVSKEDQETNHHHAIHALNLLSANTEQQLIVYGGASGIIVIQSLNILPVDLEIDIS
jgi:hypothetical protein